MRGGDYSPEEDDILRADTKAGVRRGETARKLGRTTQSVRHRCHKLKLGPLPPGSRSTAMPLPKLREAAAMRAEGATLRAIAKAFGIKSVANVHYALDRYSKYQERTKTRTAEGSAPCAT